jgi:protein-L-isoaspartate(D-aspartate) O-methyltransferase
MNIKDDYRHKGLRKKLVEEIASKGIQDKRILDAIGKIPRHLFLDSSFLEYAYQDKAFPIGAGQTISQPYTVAFQTALLDVKKGDKILEIGTGSGYQACVLMELGARVYSVERQKSLYVHTKNLLAKMNYHPRLFYGDGYKGLLSFAPFDKILITAAAPEIPEALKKQLKPNGRIILPFGEENIQEMLCVIKKDNENYTVTKHGQFQFVPMLKGKESSLETINIKN